MPGLAAKPIIDIRPVVSGMDAARACKPRILELGAQFTAERDHWLAFERYDEEAPQQYAVHIHTEAARKPTMSVVGS